MLVDTLWYLDRTRLRPEAEAVAEAVESYLLSERKGLNVPEREVEEAVAGIADDADPELLLLRYGLTGPLRASSFTWRLISANNCHRYDRRREKDIRLGKGRTKTVTGKEEHPVNRWIRTVADDVVMAFVGRYMQKTENEKKVEAVARPASRPRA